MELPIIIIGSMCAGKTTIAKVLTKKLALPRYPLDSLRWYYYAKSGLDLTEDDKMQKGKFEKLLEFRKPHDLYTIRSVLKEFQNGIIEFGASHSCWEDKEDLDKVKKLVKNIKNVVLLLPTTDNKRNIQILNERLSKRNKCKDINDIKRVNRKMVLGRSNGEIAKLVAYTQGKSPKQVAAWIISKLK
jgi:adenylate kinase family enzyme